MNARTSLGWMMIVTTSLLAACVSDEPGIGVVVDDGGAASGGDGGGGGTDGGTGTDGSTISDGGPLGDGAIATAPPAHAAKAVAFVDIDPRTGTVGGMVRITKADDESDIENYVVYPADDAGAKQSTTALGTVKANGKNVVFALPDGTSIAAGTTKLLVLSQNSAGENASGPTTAYKDAVVYATALTPATTATPFGGTPSIAFDAKNQKLVMVAAEILYHCNLDGTGCTSANFVSSGQVIGQSTPFFVPSTSNVVMAGVAYSNFNPVVVTSTLDGVGSTPVPLSTPQSSANYVAAYLDSSRGRLVVVADDHSTDVSPSARDVMFDCAYDGTGCGARRDISGTSTPDTQASNAGQSPMITLDPTNNKYVVVSQTGAGTVFALVCPTSSGACIGHNGVTGTSAAASLSPVAMFDAVADKLIIAAHDTTHSPVMTICAPDATGCSSPTEMTAGTGVGEKKISYGFTALLEPNAQMVVAAGTVGGFPVLFRCKPDGTGCEFGDMTQSSGNWAAVAITTDPASGQPYVLALTNSGSNPWLFTMR